MNYSKTILIAFLLLLHFTACEREEVDRENPVIDLTLQDAFPVNCDTLYFGETFQFRVLFRDNAALGSTNAFSINIHHNFDHHSHSTEVNSCDFAPEKAPVNPFVFIADYDIPEGIKEFETNRSVSVPYGNEEGLFDEGDYHFFISLTDKEGWSAQVGLSIKILYR